MIQKPYAEAWRGPNGCLERGRGVSGCLERGRGVSGCLERGRGVSGCQGVSKDEGGGLLPLSHLTQFTYHWRFTGT